MNTLLGIILAIILNSCTLSFQNISTHGTATDVADSDPSNQVTANPVVDIPMPLVP